MAPPPGRLGSGVKLPVQVRMFPEEMEAVDTFAVELSQQRYGAAFNRAEALRMVALKISYAAVVATGSGWTR
jgi:hypothetical protein